MYKHVEAFCLIKYQCAICGTKEIIWNSRDGNAPAYVPCLRCGETMLHLGATSNLFAPDYTPHSGQRVFINLPEELKDPLARNVLQIMYNNTFPNLTRKQKGELKKTRDQFKDGAPFLITWK